MDPATKPSVLFIYFTYSNQTRKVIDAMAEVLRDRGCDVHLADLEEARKFADGLANRITGSAPVKQDIT